MRAARRRRRLCVQPLESSRQLCVGRVSRSGARRAQGVAEGADSERDLVGRLEWAVGLGAADRSTVRLSRRAARRGSLEHCP